MGHSERFIFIMDSDSYSGNFERETCAYITGQIGECEVGDKQAKEFEEEVEDIKLRELFEETIEQVPDDDGCRRPCAVGSTPGYGNTGMGKFKKIETEEDKKEYPYPAGQSVEIYFYKRPTEEMLKLMKERATIFGKRKPFNILGFRLIKRTTRVEDELLIK